MDSKTILDLFYVKNGWRKDLIFQKREDFQKWQKKFARVYCFLVNLMLTRYGVTSMLLERGMPKGVENFNYNIARIFT